MTTSGWLLFVGAAFSVGGAVGCAVAWHFARAKHAVQARRAADELHHKFSSTIEQLRVGQMRVQNDLQKARSTSAKQLGEALAEPRAATARAEERLRAAYAELDRLRGGTDAADSGVPPLTDGFAATRPMHTTM